MIIQLNIPTNDYVQPTMVRQEVVQGICDAFLSNCAWSIFHPCSDGRYRSKTLCIIKHSNSNKYHGFGTTRDTNYVRFNGREMEVAFQALIQSGYHMFKVYQYGSWMGYVCSKKPYYENGVEVFSFNDFID